MYEYKAYMLNGVLMYQTLSRFSVDTLIDDVYNPKDYRFFDDFLIMYGAHKPIKKWYINTNATCEVLAKFNKTDIEDIHSFIDDSTVINYSRDNFPERWL